MSWMWRSWSGLSGSRVSLPVSSVLPMAPERIRLQAVYIDFSVLDPAQNLNLALMTTNQGGWDLQ